MRPLGGHRAGEPPHEAQAAERADVHRRARVAAAAAAAAARTAAPAAPAVVRPLLRLLHVAACRCGGERVVREESQQLCAQVRQPVAQPIGAGRGRRVVRQPRVLEESFYQREAARVAVHAALQDVDALPRERAQQVRQQAPPVRAAQAGGAVVVRQCNAAAAEARRVGGGCRERGDVLEAVEHARLLLARLQRVQRRGGALRLAREHEAEAGGADDEGQQNGNHCKKDFWEECVSTSVVTTGCQTRTDALVRVGRHEPLLLGGDGDEERDLAERQHRKPNRQELRRWHTPHAR